MNWEPWWKRYPDRLKDEFASLERNRIRYEKDLEAEANGVLSLRLWYPLSAGSEQELIATYPDNYPFFRFEVAAPNLQLPYHQHARAGNLCLLGRRTDLWMPEELLGDLLKDQLERVLTSGGQQTVSADLLEQEEHQAEPYSDYYEYEPEAILLISSEWSIPVDVPFGTIKIGLESSANPVRGTILEVLDSRGNVLARTAEELARNYREHLLEGRWARFEEPPSAKLGSPELYRQIRERDLYALPLRSRVDGGSIEIKGALFPEEVQWRGTPDPMRDGWFFVVRFEPDQKRRNQKRSLGSKEATPSGSSYYLVRAGRAGRSDLTARIPELGLLHDYCVAQFGVGCIGAPSSLEFCRAGLREIRLLDHDFVEPGSVVRWPKGLEAAGQSKVGVLARTLWRDYPYTQVIGFQLKIGAPGNGSREDETLSTMLDGAHLLYDATAEYGVQRFLAFHAQQRGIPYIGVESTPGGWGGIVVRIRPGMTEGCWDCLQWAKADNLIPTPPFDPDGDHLQPAGCADPTYGGANFDLMEVAMAGVRTTVSTLCGGREGAYPEMDWDIAVLELREQETGKAILPRWSHFSLDRHPKCPSCSALNAR